MATLTLQPDETTGFDTRIQEGSPDNAAANAAILEIFGSAGTRRNSLIKFDLSSIPSGSTINSATLTLWNSTSTTGNKVIDVHRVLPGNSGWDEDCTWNYANPTTLRWAGDTDNNGGANGGCSVAGTDYQSAATGSVTSAASAAIDTAHEVTLAAADLEAMLTANHGFVLLTLTTAGATKAFHSSSGATATTRPKLVVVYTEATITATVNVTLGAATLAATGALALSGATNATLDAANANATGTLLIAGQVASTLDAATLTATGSLTLQTGTGSLSVTLAPATVTASGTLAIVAQVNGTLDAATLTATAGATIAGSLTATLAPATVSAAATLQITAVLVAVLGEVTAVSRGGTLHRITYTAEVEVNFVVSASVAVL